MIGPYSKLAGVLLLAALSNLASGSHPAPGKTGLFFGVVWYTRAPNDATIAWAAKRFQIGITGKEERIDQAAVKSHNPDFEWFVYNSITDNFVPPHRGSDEHAALLDLARQKGWDAEDAYLHYAEDTRLVLEGDTLFIPGWPHGRAGVRSEARIPVYAGDGSRRLVNFSTPRSARLNKELVVRLAMDTPFDGTHIYANGIFLDNAAARLFHFGEILSGGEVQEAGGITIQSPAFQKWQWNKNLGPFLTSLKDTLEHSEVWTHDHERKRLMINVSDIWDDSYVTRDTADILFLEFLYSPVRNFGQDAVNAAYVRDRLAADAGISTFYAASVIRSVPQRGTMSYDAALLGNFAWYLVSRTDTSIFFEKGSNAPHTPGWDTLVWRGCLETAARELGHATGPPFAIAQGVDGAHNRYRVMARRYENGFALVRNRADGDQGLGPETAVAVKLPFPMTPVDASGRISRPVTEVDIRNGEGAIVLGRAGK